MDTDEKIEALSARRVRLGLGIAGSFALVLASIAMNDALVHAGKTQSPERVAVLAFLTASGALLIACLARFFALTFRSTKDPSLKRQLWDELARANHTHAMVFAYLAMLLLLIVMAVISMFFTLSAPWVINGLLITAFGIQALSFALLERRGTDRND